MPSTEAVEEPEDEAQQHAEKEGGGQWKEDRPAPAAPAQIAWKTPQRQVGSAEKHDQEAGKDERGSDQEKSSSKREHARQALRAQQHGAGLAQQVDRLTGLPHDGDIGSAVEVSLPDALQVHLGTRENEDPARG